MNRRVLLLEPNYKNKFPPIGLMKLATYFRLRGDDVVFYKGDLKEFVINQITEACIAKLSELDNSINWKLRSDKISLYIKYRKREYLDRIGLEDSEIALILEPWLEYYKKYYHSGEYKKYPQWDWVGVTTLFTFYWDITIETIEFAKTMVKDLKNLMVGGVLASIQPKEIEKATGIRPHVGTLHTPGKDIDALFQGAEKIIVQDAVRFIGQNIVVAKALACGELVEKLPGIPQGPDIEDADARLCDGKKEILEGAVQLRAQIPEHHKLLPSALCQLPR